MVTEKQNIQDRPGRIVLVDDDEFIRDMVRDAFKKYEPAKGVVFATCGSAKEFLARARELQPELLLLDVMMPDMDGVDCIAAMSEHPDCQNIPIIFFTGNDAIVMHEKYKRLGVLGVIHKSDDHRSVPQAVFQLWKDSGMIGEDGQVLTDLMDREDTNTFKEEN